MVKNAGNENAEEYLKTYQKELSAESSFSSGSPAVDALLTAKSLTMSKAGISFDCSLYPFDRLPMSSTKFCTMLGNLLDNAIEGVQRLPDTENRIIHLKFHRPGEMLLILLKNPCNPDTIHLAKGQWLSSKFVRTDGSTHPIGIRTIERIVREAEGRCEFMIENRHFIVKILLPFLSHQTA